MKRKRNQAYFYPKLKGKRNELGITLDEMAKKLGISTDAYFRKEKGKTDFYLCEVRKILELFDCKYEEIFFTPDVNQRVDDTDYDW